MAILSVSVPKGGGATLDVDIDAIPPEAFSAIVLAGLEAYLGKRMSKITGLTKLSGDDLTKAHEAATKIATENLANIMAGKITAKGKKAKADGVSREVKTEAIRLAKAVVKDQIRAAGMKISHVAAKDITAAANELIANDPSYFETAKANIAARATIQPTLDIKSLISESPALVAKATAKAEANKAAGLSKTQAGKVKPRKRNEAKPEAVTT